MRPGIPVIYRKALRDLWQLRSQALAIVGVVMAGIAMLTMLQIAFHSLLASRDHLFSAAQGNLPDVWVSLKRAPEAVARQVAALPGVAQVQTRIMASGKLALAGVDEPLQTQLVSLPDDGRQPVQNRLFLQAGRRPAPWSRDEVVISEAFAAVHHLQPGARLQVTVNGRTQGFRVVGVGGSPEFLYQLAPGSVFPDHAHFAVLWVPRSTLAAAMNMKGAFNALSATLSRQGAAPGHEADALAAIDHVLDRWGGLGAIGRDEQISTRRLRDELAQIQINVRLLPTVFLAVAAFLLHVVFTRLVGLQRGQIAILKAFGYRTSTVVLHYALMAATICVAGALLGVLAGSGMGHWLAVTYQHNFRFPSLHHAVDLMTVLTGVVVAVLAGMAGASQAVLRAVREPVAQAMRPQPPERYRVAGIGQGLVARYLPQPARMVLRHLVRHPGRALLTVAGLAMLVNFGVVYNAARITLAERMRELASLRVLGFTRSEVAHILMGEIGLLVLLSIPLSFACGWGLGWLMVQGMQNDLYRVSLTLPPEGYALAALVTLTSTLVSMAAVLRLMNRMDMLEVLQNRV